MTLEMLVIAAVRLLGALPVLRWPFYGGLAALVIDQSDLLLMNLLHLGGVNGYQTFDKYLDQAYLLTFLGVALGWRGAAKTIALALYAYRLVGFVAFEATQERDLLLFFPNLFEFWFLLVAGLKQFQSESRLASAPVIASAAALLALKLFQEYAIHYARWLDGFTTLEALDAVWRWLIHPFV